MGINNADEFFGHLQQDPIFDLFDRGRSLRQISGTVYREKIGNPALTDQQIDDAWNSILVGIAEGNHDLFLKLKDKYRTFLLSNINDIHYDYIMKYLKRDFGFDNNDHLFEKAYYSHLTGKRKPDYPFLNRYSKKTI